MHARLALTLAALATAGCGGAQPPVKATPGSPKVAPAAPSDDWAPLSWEERHDLMTWSVLPAMMPVIQRTFATANPELNCRTCHGPNAEAVAYKMPNGLAALDPARMPSGKVADAMQRDVLPLMSDLVGKAETCFSCHPSARGGS